MGDALKGVITRAHCDQIRSVVSELVEQNQLGMLKGGYETGVHAMRALANQCEIDGEVILIIDFTNAFNACNRNLILKLAATFIPEIAHLIFWLYARDMELYLSTEKTVTSSEGVHKVCGFSNMLFVVLMRWVMQRIPKQGVSATESYLDDLFTKSTPAAEAQI